MASFFRLKCFFVASLAIMTFAGDDISRSCKTNEIYGPTEEERCLNLCGDLFMSAYVDLCYPHRKRASDMNAGS